jgi:hypothetical protein
MKAPDVFQRSGTWILGVLYFNRKDPRVIVPKRYRLMGWTLNFARPMAIPSLILIILAVLVPIEILDYFGIESVNIRGLIIVADILGLIAFCAWRANPSRYLKDSDSEQN